MKFFTVALLVVPVFSWIQAYKTVVLVHGLNSDGGEFYNLKPKILNAHPGTNVVELNYSPTYKSLDPIPDQLKWFNESLQEVLRTIEDDIHLICHSQGGLLCLGYLTATENHRVNTFISLSSPLFGQYGLPKSVIDDVPILAYIKPLVNIIVSKVVYDYTFQHSLSIANYWRDPRSSIQETYEKNAIFLPVVLNDPASRFYNATEASRRKKNFLNLQHLVLAGGPDDEIIKPWQSPLFGYFDGNPMSGRIVNMTEQKVFTEDWFGLRTLHETNRLHPYVMAGINHNGWVVDDNVFQNIIIDWLT